MTGRQASFHQPCSPVILWGCDSVRHSVTVDTLEKVSHLMLRRLSPRLRLVHCGIALVLSSLLFTEPLTAEVPAVTALFPSGVQAGQAVSVKLQGAVGTAPVEVWIDRTDLTIQATEKPDEFTFTATADARPGVAWVRWHNAEGASDLRPFVMGTLPEMAEVEPNNATQEAQVIPTSPVIVNGSLHKGGELDTFAVTLKAGETLVASMEANRTLPSPMDAVLQLVDTQGFVIEQNDDWLASDPQIVWTAPADGTWLIRIFTFPSTPDSTIQYAGGANDIYRLLLTTGPVINHVVPLLKQPGEVTPHGWNLPAEKLTVTGDLSALRLSAFSNGSPTPVTFSMDQLPASQGSVVIEDAVASVQMLTIPSSVSGTIEVPGDSDRFQFFGMKGQAFRFRTHTKSLGSQLDPVVRFLNSTGEVVTVQDDSGELVDPNFDIVIPVDDNYTVEVSDRFQTGSEWHFYSLTLLPEVPDLELSVAGNRFTLDRAKPLEIPVTINRLTGLNVPIQFTVEGLPAGVTFEPVESKPEGDTAKAVTLKLSVAADSATARGPIQIVGRTIGPDLTRQATGPIEGVKATTSQLWITLPAK